MRRKIVTLYVSQGAGQKRKDAQARCETCRCFERCKFGDQDHSGLVKNGHCYFFPMPVLKDESDWCQQYVPDMQMFD